VILPGKNMKYADNNIFIYSVDIIKEALDYAIYIEHNYINLPRSK